MYRIEQEKQATEEKLQILKEELLQQLSLKSQEDERVQKQLKTFEKKIVILYFSHLFK